MGASGSLFLANVECFGPFAYCKGTEINSGCENLEDGLINHYFLNIFKCTLISSLVLPVTEILTFVTMIKEHRI